MSRLRWISLAGLAGVSLSLVVALEQIGEAGTPKVGDLDGFFERDDGRLARGFLPPSRAPHTGDHGGTIAADGQGLWIAERNAGALIRTDHAGELRTKIDLHANLGELLLDEPRGTLYVADRTADKLLRFSVSADAATPKGELPVIEPYGLALTPDASTLLVTSVANQELVAIDTASWAVRWRVALAPEPRAVAVAPDGKWAVVGFLTSDAIARIDLADQRVIWMALAPRDHVEIEREDGWEGEFSEFARTVEAGSRFEVPNDIGRRHIRNVFALSFVGDDTAVVAHQLSTSQLKLRPAADRRDAYGGGGAEIPPIEYRIARVGAPAVDGSFEVDHHILSVHQPRALAYDRKRDVLYVGGYGDDELVALGKASTERPELLFAADLGRGPACGLDGITTLGEQVFVHCELARRVIRIDLEPGQVPPRTTKSKTWIIGPELAASLRDDAVERGAELFRRGEHWALGGPLACASCHPEGRSDSLSWRLGRSILQTPMLAGRVHETGPYKWTGEDSSLKASFQHTLERIGGDPNGLEGRDFAGLEAYLTSLPRPRAPVREPNGDGLSGDLARGQAIFERECSSCHAGERFTDRERYELETSLPKVDTPSLIGLAHTAPYYHDGSAINLDALLDDRGSIHDMVDTSGLSADERRDLITFLESL